MLKPFWSGARTLLGSQGACLWPFGLCRAIQLPLEVTCDFVLCGRGKQPLCLILGAAASVLGDPIPFTNYECMYVCMHALTTYIPGHINIYI